MPNDSQDLMSYTVAMPTYVRHGMTAARGLDGLPERDRVENIVVLGMGASGVAGEVLNALASPFVPVPITVVRDYQIPAFVGEGSLVFALSYSGDTEETIEAASAAAAQGAKMVVISSSGVLGELATSWGAPLVHVPIGIPQRRMALGALAASPLIVLEEIGLFPGATAWLEDAIAQLEMRKAELLQPGNVAEHLANRLNEKLVVVHGGGVLGAVAAKRWKQQLNEHAKTLAFFAAQPELCHNEIAGLDGPSHIVAQSVVVSLRHDDEHPQVSRRIELVQNQLQLHKVSVEEVRAQGEGIVAQLFDLLLFGDFVALSLAKTRDIDTGLSFLP